MSHDPSEIILISDYAALIFLWKIVISFFQIFSGFFDDRMLKSTVFIENINICSIINVFTITVDQCNVCFVNNQVLILINASLIEE